MKKKKKTKKNAILKTLRLVVAALLLAPAAVAAFIAWCWYSYNAPVPKLDFPRGSNAMWVQHSWVGERRPKSDYAALCAQLEQYRMSDIFAHAGPLDKRGLVPPDKYPYAARFLRGMRKNCPQVRVQAWLGQIEKTSGGPLDLSAPLVRSNIVTTAAAMLDAGFDGVHYDIETIRPGNQDFIALLRDTSRAAKPRHKILSIASMQFEPLPLAGKALPFFAKNASLWDKKYYLQAAQYTDQFAVMMYDTAMPTDWLYGKLTQWQTANTLRMFHGKKTIFMGVPTYKDKRRKTMPNDEHIRAALRGINHGLADTGEKSVRNFGVAIYAEWTTSPEEWKVYSRDWLARR